MKRFITVRMWEDTKEKLEEIRFELMQKRKKVVSLAETIEILIENYNKNKNE